MLRLAAAGIDARRRNVLLAAVMLVLALVPIIVAVARAATSGWVPTFDAGYFTVRSRDVLTEHHPWIGAWSWGSVTLGTSVNSLGSLQLDLLAPFTKVEPYWGTAVGVGTVAAGSVVMVWWSARRVGGPLAASLAMLATLAVEGVIGSQAFIDPRQQLYLLLPYWALLWLAWAVMLGHGAAIPPLVFTASLVVQTHFTYAVPTTLLLGAACGLFVVSRRRTWREARATGWMLIGLGVGLASWAQPLWDQFYGEGNLGAVLGARSGSAGVGWGKGARIVATSVLAPPRFWVTTSMGEFNAETELVSSGITWMLITGWLALLVASTIVAWRSRSSAATAFGVIATVALGAAVAATARIPPTPAGLARQNYFWLWPTGVFLTTALVAMWIAELVPVRARMGTLPAAVGVVVAGVTLAVVVAGSAAAPFVDIPSERTAGERVARPVVEQLEVALRAHQGIGPVLIDYSRSSSSPYVKYVLLAELQRADTEFTFPAGDRNLHRFGDERCESGRATARIVLLDGESSPPRLKAGEVVLARVDAFSTADERDLSELDERFGDYLRDGRIPIDVGGLEYLTGRRLPGLRAVMAEPGRDAAGLATLLGGLHGWGLVDVPRDLVGELGDWVELETRAVRDVVTILLVPIDDDAPIRRC